MMMSMLFCRFSELFSSHRILLRDFFIHLGLGASCSEVKINWLQTLIHILLEA